MNDTYDYYYAVVNQGYSLTINGTTTNGSTASLSSTAGGTATLLSASVWVAYTGSKAITISGTANMSNIYRNGTTALGTRSVSGTATLDTLGSKPSASAVSAPTTSIISETATSITITWAKNADSTAKYTLQVSKNGGSYTNVTTGIANATVSYAYAITAGQGNTYRFRLCATNSMGSSSYSYSGTVTTNKLTAPTIGTLSTYNPYVTAALSVPLSGGSQTNGGAFTRRAALYYGSILLANCTAPSNGNTAASITYAAASYASRLGTTKYSGTFKIVAWTQNSNGSKSSTVSKTFTVNLNSDGGAVPTLAAPTLSGGFTGYTATCFIAGISSLSVTSGSASVNRAPSGTTLTYSISCTGFSTVASSSTTFSKPTAGRKAITVTVTDSRGLSTSKTVYCRFQSWAKPTVKITKAERNTTTPTTINVTYTVTYSPIYNTYGSDGNTAGTNINGISVQQYTTASTYTNCTSPITITGTSSTASYTVTVRASDKIATTTYGTASKFVGTVEKYIALRDNSIGLGCVPSSAFRLDVNGDMRIYDADGNIRFNGGSIYTTGSVCIPNGKYIYSYRADGTSHAMLAMSTADSVVLNYVGYRDQIGATNIYGNTLNLLSNNTIVTNNSIEVTGQIYGKGYNHIIGSNRLTQTWTGYYPTYTDALNATNRTGWIGHSSASSSVFQVVNEQGSTIWLRAYQNGVVSAGATLNNTTFCPETDNIRACGHASYRWTNVYAVNGTINTSDRNYKKNIKELDEKYIQLFYRLLPVSFEFNYESSDRIHVGFISQDVEDAMNDLGISDLEFAGFCKDKQQIYNEDNDSWEDVLDEDGNPVYIYSLRYQEFIALNTYMIQKQQKEINELKQLIKGGEDNG